tara:strand:- start:3560 stop:4027 length:468 start_codon:yes stop_codon:yes gene_type:complete
MIDLTVIPYHVICDYIEPYTRKCQKRGLCIDIYDFITTITVLHRLYSYKLFRRLNRHRDLSVDFYPYELMYVAKASWFFAEMDIWTFIAHEDLDVLDRLPIAQICLKILTISEMSVEDYKLSKSRVYRLWGLLSTSERQIFLNKYSYIRDIELLE